MRHLTELEPILTSLPIAIRDKLPATSRVMTCLNAVHKIDTTRLALNPADHVKLKRLVETRAVILRITAELRELDQQIPALLRELQKHLDRDHRRRRGYRHGPTHRGRRSHTLRHRSTVRTLVRRGARGRVLRGRAPRAPSPPT